MDNGLSNVNLAGKAHRHSASAPSDASPSGTIPFRSVVPGMNQNATSAWLTLAADSYQLWADSVAVIGLRTTGLMTGAPGSGDEAVRMVTEKLQANAELAMAVALGGPTSASGLASKTVRHYGKRVRANRRRLAKR